jgi:murein DD-endopeptidase
MRTLSNRKYGVAFIRVWTLCIVVFGTACTVAIDAQTRFGVPVHIEVPVGPSPVKAEGKVHLVYEVHVTNFREPDLTLLKFEVIGRQPDTVILASYGPEQIAERLARPGAPANLKDELVIGGGVRGVMFLWITLDTPYAVPLKLTHRLTFKAPGSEVPVVVEGGEANISNAKPLILGPPLRDGIWVAARGPSNISGHRRALIANEGKAYIAQRFAIDWMKVGMDKRVTPDDHQSKNESWYGYGADVIAVADATVAAINDGIPENVPLSGKMAVAITSATVGGNSVVLNLGGGMYAFYGHLQPGRLKVTVGQKVRRGQLLGFLGNSGNSDAPHLHFHVSDGIPVLGGEGLPFVIPTFHVLGASYFDPQKKTPGERRSFEIPLENAVVLFR